MRVKSYFTNTVESAVSLARVELGPEALLISVRRTTLETKIYGNYEVVFGLAAPEAAVPQKEQPVTVPPRDMRPPSTADRPTERMALLDSNVGQTLIDDLIASMEKRIGTNPENPNAIHGALTTEMESRFEIYRGPLTDPTQPCIAAFIGPHGAGKTTTLVKLAVIQGLVANRPVEIVSLDTHRVGAMDTLRSYAAALNVGFYPLDNPALLPHALEDLTEGNTLILIDTPGCGKDEASLSALAKTLSRRQDIEAHLVLPATMGDRELRRAVDRFTTFHPASLLFTRMDETAGFGRILTESARTKLPLSYFGVGPEVPEDLEIASKQSLVGRVIGRRREEAMSAC